MPAQRGAIAALAEHADEIDREPGEIRLLDPSIITKLIASPRSGRGREVCGLQDVDDVLALLVDLET